MFAPFLALVAFASSPSARAGSVTGPNQSLYYQCAPVHKGKFHGVHLADFLSRFDDVDLLRLDAMAAFPMVCTRSECVIHEQYASFDRATFPATDSTPLRRLVPRNLTDKQFLRIESWPGLIVPTVYVEDKAPERSVALVWKKVAILGIAYGRVQEYMLCAQHDVEPDGTLALGLARDVRDQFTADARRLVKGVLARNDATLAWPGVHASPHLPELVKTVIFEATDGTYLGGSQIGLAVGVTSAALLAQRAAAYFEMLASRNPALGAAFVPNVSAPRVTLDLAALGLSADDAKRFFAASDDGRARLCGDDRAYAQLCRSLDQVDRSMALAAERAL